MGFFDNLNIEEVNAEILKIEVNIKQKQFKVKQLQEDISILDKDIVNSMIDYEMLKFLKLKSECDFLSNEYLKINDLETLLHTISKTTNNHRIINKKQEWKDL